MCTMLLFAFQVNLYPYYRTLSKAYIDLIEQWDWSGFTILYETNEGECRCNLKGMRGFTRTLDQ